MESSKPKRGRPKGSKNRHPPQSTTTNEGADPADGKITSNLLIPGGAKRGRPKNPTLPGG